MRTIWAPNSILYAADMVTLLNSCDHAGLLRDHLGAAGEEVNVRGAKALGDGGDGNWRWDESSTGTDDGVFIVQPTVEPRAGRWVRIIDDTFYRAAWWGVDASGVTSSDTAIQAADVAAAAAGRPLLIAAGIIRLNVSYSFQAPIVIENGARIRPDSGVSIVLLDTPAVAHNGWIFDISAGGSIAIARPSRPVVPQWWGALGKAIVASIAVAITAGQHSLVATLAQWTQADVGKLIIVPAAGDPGGTFLSELHTLIDAVSIDGKTVTTHDPAGLTVTSGSPTRVIYGVDETSAIQAALRCSAAALPIEVDFPAGTYLHQFGQPAISTVGLDIRGLGRARIIGITPSSPPGSPIIQLTGAASSVEKINAESTAGTTIAISVATNSVTKTASFTVDRTVKYHYLDPTSAAITATLPADPVVDEEHVFKDATGQASVNAISLNGNGHPIDGVSGTILLILTAYGFGRVVFNGTQWSLFA
jgi:hypothetical protein